jgi:acetoacetyl-[acyl-carrier protein] synthase
LIKEEIPMSRLPVIVGFGGFNAAGRSSFHHGYRRTVIESLSAEDRQETLVGLATLMKLVSFTDGQYTDTEGNTYTAAEVASTFEAQILNSTLVRRIEEQHLDVDNVHWHKEATIAPAEGEPLTFVTKKKQLPDTLPDSWQVTELADGMVKVQLLDGVSVKFDATRELPVKSAGQLPKGFEPGEHYNSRFHPRGLQLTVVAASDAVQSTGIDWQTIVDAVAPDEISVYASSAMGQNDENGNGGMMKSRLMGSRVTAKQLPLGLNTMPADFINAYVLGSVGQTGALTGACASFLYNLQAGVNDITSGKRRVVLVGAAEAPIQSEIIDGYGNMSALASVDGLKKVLGTPEGEEPDYRRASRPFGENCGFTLAESAQFFMLMDDALALELGADIYGAIPEVFINADGSKKSISAPGPGNYITMAKSLANAAAIIGTESVRERSFVQAHGSSTPANRVTESMIFDKVAAAFDIKDWSVAAVKAFVGHPLATASGDQLASSLGVFKYGIVPGVKTIDKVADDVYAERLNISISDVSVGQQGMDVSFLNSKGFGGNNASAAVFAPHIVEAMMTKRYGEEAMAAYRERRETVRQQAQAYEQAALAGDLNTIYRFGENMIDEAGITITSDSITMPGFDHKIDLAAENPYQDMV